MKKRMKWLAAVLCASILTSLLWTPTGSRAQQINGSNHSASEAEEEENGGGSAQEEEKEDPDADTRQQIDDDKKDLNGARDEKSQMQGALSSIRKQKDDLETIKEDLSNYVVELDGELTSLQDKLAQIEELIAQKEQEISQITIQLAEAKENEVDQYASMKQRIRFMYERGNESYISAIFGAADFGEMLNKAEYIEKLSGYDRRMLEQYHETKEAIAQLKSQLESDREALNGAYDEAQEKEGEMNDLIDAKNRQIVAYDQDINNKEKAIKEYEAEIAAQNAAIAALEAKIAAAEATLSGNDAAPVYGGGKFCWPAPSYTRISDDYGNRIHPTLGVQQFHNGIDMAAPSGSPILAAESGTVVAAAYSSSMGNYIMINHGSGVYTIYMHASALYVSAGQSVSRGNKIAAVGSTGRSTGPHLHFSVRVNGGYVSPWSYLK